MMAAGMTSIRGLQDVLRNIEKAKVAAVKGAERGVDRARLAVETTAKKLIMRGPKTGWMYQRINIGGYMHIIQKRPDGDRLVALYHVGGLARPNLSEWHKASAPGQSPATDTGTLASSIESKRDGLVAVVWTEKEYGKWLEFGTSRMEPRPWLTPAVEQNREKFPKELGAAVVESINQAVKA